MRIAVLGATGRVGHLVVEEALRRGHEVVALVRRPHSFVPPAVGDAEVRQADVTDPTTFPDLSDVEVVISAIGIRKGDGPGALVAAAHVLAQSGVRVLWLGALGSGVSTGAGGALYQLMMHMFVGAELTEKAEADALALDSGATIFHAPDLRVGRTQNPRRNVPLPEYRKPVLPPWISRATAAASMLDEAEHPTVGAEILVPTTKP